MPQDDRKPVRQETAPLSPFPYGFAKSLFTRPPPQGTPETPSYLILSRMSRPRHALLCAAAASSRGGLGEPPAPRASSGRQRVTLGCPKGVFRVALPGGQR
jgi:hypothetical protein